MRNGTLFCVAKVVILAFFIFTTKPLEAAWHLDDMKYTQGVNNVSFPDNKAAVPPSRPLVHEAASSVDDMKSTQGVNKVSFPDNKAAVPLYKHLDEAAASPVDDMTSTLGVNKLANPENKGAVPPSSPNPCSHIPKGDKGHCNK